MGRSPGCTRPPWCVYFQNNTISLLCKMLDCAILSAPSIHLEKRESQAENSCCWIEIPWSWEKREKINSVLIRVGKESRKFSFSKTTTPPSFSFPDLNSERSKEGTSHKSRAKSTSDEGAVVCYRSWTRCLQNKINKIFLPKTCIPCAFWLD